jgi:hypothetical protein
MFIHTLLNKEARAGLLFFRIATLLDLWFVSRAKANVSQKTEKVFLELLGGEMTETLVWVISGMGTCRGV